MKAKWNRAELAAAFAFMATGFGALWIARDYPVGSVTRMGPGFVPITLGVLLVACAAIAAIQNRNTPPSATRPRLKPFVLIMGGILAWALLIDRVGFVPSTVILVLACASVEISSTWRSSLLLAAGLCVAGYAIFIRGLGIPLSPFGG
ncbi:tripartite tricarboxylate transporter TctB family protein [Stappia stellulata]|uniref:tripartite tricarboxylate transporter TctB family protein n=1 Tax=Stappia stellulata TaxID=71235 RepID=UPI000419C842|nr:tripartite tricarboxylate transporter TctB family protein [Stappia stellulata]